MICHSFVPVLQREISFLTLEKSEVKHHVPSFFRAYTVLIERIMIVLRQKLSDQSI